ncbi:hypothetical protein K439DRAFT_448634 [Ramaria rubella]|nr:hypothetical protein K439DRAFT_448634 [Ramaria rubella]
MKFRRGQNVAHKGMTQWGKESSAPQSQISLHPATLFTQAIRGGLDVEQDSASIGSSGMFSCSMSDGTSASDVYSSSSRPTPDMPLTPPNPKTKYLETHREVSSAPAVLRTVQRYDVIPDDSPTLGRLKSQQINLVNSDNMDVDKDEAFEHRKLLAPMFEAMAHAPGRLQRRNSHSKIL